jgi:hypothetical protein
MVEAKSWTAVVISRQFESFMPIVGIVGYG